MSQLELELPRQVRRAQREEGRIVHFVVERDHIHLIVEADDARACAQLMQRLQIRTARGLNAVLGRSGRVFVDRYHVRALETPPEVHYAVTYVLNNHRKHTAE